MLINKTSARMRPLSKGHLQGLPGGSDHYPLKALQEGPGQQGFPSEMQMDHRMAYLKHQLIAQLSLSTDHG